MLASRRSLGAQAPQVNRVDPRFSKTAAFANQYVRLRSGTDVAFIYGLIYIILKNGWEDKRMLNERTYGLQALVDEVGKFDPDSPPSPCSTF